MQIFVGNLPWSTTEAELTQLFSPTVSSDAPTLS